MVRQLVLQALDGCLLVVWWRWGWGWRKQRWRLELQYCAPYRTLSFKVRAVLRLGFNKGVPFLRFVATKLGAVLLVEFYLHCAKLVFLGLKAFFEVLWVVLGRCGGRWWWELAQNVFLLLLEKLLLLLLKLQFTLLLLHFLLLELLLLEVKLVLLPLHGLLLFHLLLS